MEIFSSSTKSQYSANKKNISKEEGNIRNSSNKIISEISDVEHKDTENELQGTGNKCLDKNVTFDTFQLSQVIYERIKNQIGLVKPTKVQAACIPPLLKGRSCISQAPTGTGKTLAFGIPMIHKWGKDPYGVFGLIITPTRELATQIKDQIQFLGGDRAKVSLIIGGVDFQQQAIELFGKPSFVVATPGRLFDHFQNAEQTFRTTFRNCKYLVYDEADKLLDGQFDDNLEGIMSALPKKKQVMFFSATLMGTSDMVETIMGLSQSTEKPFIYDYQDEGEEPKNIDIQTLENSQNEKEDEKAEGEMEENPKNDIQKKLSKIPITQKYILCPRDFKDGYLMELLRSIRDKDIKLPVKVRSMIIFAATIRETQVLSLMLTNLGFDNTTLHSHLDQKSRAKALSDFRSCHVNTLVATDVVSRGLDIRTVDLVINYSIPMPPDYVHRIGRTGRAGQPGLAIMFVVPTRDLPFLKNVEKYIGEKLTEMKIDERKVLKILTDVQANRKIADLTITETDPFEERAKINKQKKEIKAALDGKSSKSKKKKRRFLDGANHADKVNSKSPKL